MAALTVSQCFGILLEDPEDEKAFDGLLDALTSGDEKRRGPEPLKLMEAARLGHMQRGETQTAARLLDLEIVATEKDPDREAALWKELARIRAEELWDDKGARDAYGKAMSLRPGDQEIHKAIEALDQASAKWKDLAQHFVTQANEASDNSLRASLLLRAAALIWQYKKKGRDKDVDALFTGALEADPGNERVLLLMEHALRDRKKTKELAQHLVTAAQTAKSPAIQAQFAVRAARVFARSLNDQPSAAAAYGTALRAEPTHAEALSFLVKFYTDQEDWDHLVALYEDSLRTRPSPEHEQGLLIQIAMMHWRMRGKPEQAEPFFARLRKFDPAHPAMLDFYREHLPKAGDEAKLVHVLADAQRMSGDSGNKLRLAIEVARKATDGQTNVDRSVDAWKAVLRLDPQNREAALALIDLYRKAQKWNALADALKVELDATDAADIARRLEILREMAAIYRERVHVDAMVISSYNAILQIAPDDQETFSQLVSMFESLGRWNDLIQLLTKHAETVSDNFTKMETYSRVANLWIDRFQNFNQAMRPLELVLAIDPDNRDALSKLKDIYGKRRAWQQLFGVLRKEADLASDPTVRNANLVELAKIAGERLQKNADAIALWREVIEDDEGTPGALDALEKLAEREKDYVTVADVLERRVLRAADVQEQIKILQRLGSLYTEQHNDSERAAAAWKRVLEIEPKNGRAVRTLREMYLGVQDFNALEDLYVELKDWEGLVDVLGTAADKSTDVATKLRLSFRAAEIFEIEIGEPARAVRAYERVLAADPKNIQAAKSLVAIYEREPKWSKLAPLYELLWTTFNEEATDPGQDEKVALASRAQQLAFEARDDKNAMRYAVAAFELDPTAPELRDALELVATKSNQAKALVDVYRNRLLALDAPSDEGLWLRRRIANLALEKLRADDIAIEQLRAVVEIEPNDTDATSTLERLFRNAGRNEDQRSLYVHRIEYAQSDSEKWMLLGELAKLEEDKLNDATSAAARYRAMLEIEPSDADTMLAIERLAKARNDFREVAEMVERRREGTTDGAARETLTMALANLYITHLNESERGMDALADILSENPTHTAAIQALEALPRTVPAQAERIEELLESSYIATSNYRELLKLLDTRRARATDAGDKREIQLRMADIYADQLNDEEGAYRTLESLFFDAPGDIDIVERLERTAERAKKQEALALAYATVIDASADSLDSNDSLELSRRATRLYTDVLGKAELAEPLLHRILAVDPLDDAAYGQLKELFTNAERWQDLQKLYAARIEQTTDESQRLELLMQVCFLFEEILDDAVQAIQSYERVVELAPDAESARRALERLYRREKHFDKLAAMLANEAEGLSGAERSERLLTLAKVLERDLNNRARAVDELEAALSETPSHEAVQDALHRLMANVELRARIATLLEPVYESDGKWARLAEVLEVLLNEAADVADQMSLLQRIAEIHEVRLSDSASALRALARAVAIDPADTHVREELARIAVAREAFGEHAAALEVAVSNAANADVKGEVLFELATLVDQQLQSAERAEKLFSELIRVDAGHHEHVLAASRALERIHLGAQNYAGLAVDLRLQIEHETTDTARRDLRAKLAHVLENELQRIEEAIAVHRDALESDGSDLDAMMALERLFSQEEKWPELADMLQSHFEIATNDDERRSLQMRLAEIADEKLHDRSRAIDAYEVLRNAFGADAAVLAALVRLYEAAEKWEELLETLGATLDLLASEGASADARAKVRAHAGDILRTRTTSIDAAVEAYKDVLDLVPDHKGAIDALLAVALNVEWPERFEAARAVLGPLTAQQQSRDLLRALEVLSHSDDNDEVQRVLRRGAEVAENDLKDPNVAFAWLARAVRSGMSEPDIELLIAEAERVATMRASHAEMLSLLRDIVGEIGDEEIRLGVLSKMATIARESLHDNAAARSFLEQIIESRPDDRTHLNDLAEVVEALGDKKALAEILSQKIALADDPGERMHLAVRQGELFENALGEADRALESYESALQEGTSDAAYRGMERLLKKAERHEELVALYERQLDAVHGSARDLHVAAGGILLQHLSEPHRALAHLRNALAIDPDFAPAIAAVESMLQNEEIAVAAADALCDVYLGKLDYKNLVRVLDARLPFESDLDSKKRTLMRMASYQEEQCRDAAAAFATHLRLFAEDTGDEAEWGTLQRLAGAVDAWPQLASVLDDALWNLEGEGEAVLHLAALVGRIHDTHTLDTARATKAYERALQIDPRQREIFDALEAIHLQNGAHEALVALYREAADAAPSDADRVDLLHRLAGVLGSKLQRANDVVAVLREILDVQPGEVRAMVELDRLLSLLQSHAELASHLEYRIEHTANDAEKHALQLRLAATRSSHLHDVGAAIDIYEGLLSSQTDRAAAVSALEALMENAEYRIRVIGILDPVYRAASDWRKLIGVLLASVPLLDGAHEKAECLGNVAVLYEEHGGDFTRAFEAWSEALREEPSYSEARMQLERLALVHDLWNEFVASVETAISANTDPATNVELLTRLAAIHDEHRGDPRSAIAVYERLYAIDESDSAILDAMDSLHTMVGDWPGLTTVLERKAKRAETGEERSELLRRVGAVQEELIGDSARAIDAYERAVAENDSDSIALEALDALYVAAENAPRLGDVLRQRLRLSDEAAERIELGMRLGRLLEQSLHLRGESILAFERVLEDAPHDVAALASLARLYAAESRWSDLLETLRRQIAVTAEPAERAELLHRVAKLLATELDDADEALRVYGEVLLLAPHHTATLLELLRITEHPSQRAAAAALLEPRLMELSRFDDLVMVIERNIELIEEMPEKRDELCKLAELHEHRRADLGAAFSALSRALACDLGDVRVADELERIGKARGATREVADTFAKLAPTALDPNEGRALAFRAGRIAEHDLNDVNGAIDAYRSALLLVDDDADCLAELDRLYTKASRFDELAEILERRLQNTAEPALTLDLLVRRGLLQLEHFHDARAALETLRDVVDRDPNEARALDALLTLAGDKTHAADAIDILDNAYRQTGALDRVVALQEKKAELAPSDAEKVRLLLDAAKLWEHELSARDRALRVLVRAYQVTPTDGDILDHIESLAEATNDAEPLRGLVESVVDRMDAPREVRRDLHIRAAGWYLAFLNDSSLAEARLRSALGLDSSATAAHAALIELLRTEGRDRDLIEALKAENEHLDNVATRVEHLTEAVAIAAQRLNDVPLTLELLERVLAVAPDDDNALALMISRRKERGEWKDAATYLEQRAHASSDAGMKVQLLHELSTVRANRLADNNGAILALESVLAIAPMDLDAMESLGVLFEKEARWPELRTIIEKRIPLEASSERRSNALLALAMLLDARLDNVDEAIDALQDALSENPDHVGAADALEALLTRTGRHEALIAALENRAQRADSLGNEALTLRSLLRIADAQEARGEVDEASVAVQRALGIQSEDDELLERLILLREKAEAWDEVASLLTDRAQNARDFAKRVAAALRLAEIAESKLNDATLTAHALQIALAEQPDNALVMASLKAHYEKHGAYAELAALMQREVETLATPGDKAAACKRIASIYETKLNDAGSAATFLEQAIALVPEDKDALLPLCDLYLAAGRQTDAIPVLQKLIASFGTRRAKELALYQHRLGRAYEALGDDANALLQYDSAFKIDLTNIGILRDLGRLTHRTGDLERAQKTFRALLLQKLDPAAGISKADIYFALGDISAKQNDMPKAISMLERAVAEDKQHHAAAELLRTLKK